ncbi:hypothetical protein [Parasphingorhabdus sp.]|uniref:hypothetical protein n=1 Tax=Parasphingorhabdus sp. TaxID=2709688 RepID=UPI002F9404D2
MLKKIVLSGIAASVAMVVTVSPAIAAQSNNDQKAARAQMISGKGKSLRAIENAVLPMMEDSQYLGPEYDPSAKVYRLKFIRQGRVIFIDVDGRTGNILRQRR